MQRTIFTAALGLLALAAAPATASAQSAPTAGCDQSTIVTKQIRCFLDAAEAAGDASLCDGAYDFAVRFNCIGKFAENSGDPAVCERIPIRNNQMLALRDACVSGVAAANKMPDLCEQVQLDVVRDTCFLIQVVEHGAAPAYCDRITRAALQRNCQAPAANRP